MDLLVLLYEEYHFNRFLNYCGEGCFISRSPNRMKNKSNYLTEESSSNRLKIDNFEEELDKYQEFQTKNQIEKQKINTETYYNENNIFKEHVLLGSKLNFFTEKIRLYIKIHLLRDSDISIKTFRERLSDLILSESILRKELIEAKFNYGGYVFKKK